MSASRRWTMPPRTKRRLRIALDPRPNRRRLADTVERPKQPSSAVEIALAVALFVVGLLAAWCAR